MALPLIGLVSRRIGLIGRCFLLVAMVVIGKHPTCGLSRQAPLKGYTKVLDDDGLCAASVTPFGYECHEFEVETKDGYILGVQRISGGGGGGGGGGDGGQNDNKQPVLIQHGLMVDGTTWFLNPPEQNLPLILADNGFDVWVVNTRGTRFSNKHVSLDPNQPEYWDWSWDELVAYDLPATFDFVSQHTGGQEIHYVGHSLGTLTALASFSEGQLADKVKSAALLSPIAYLSHMTTVFGVMLARSFVGEMTALLGVAEFNLENALVARFVRGFCSIPGVDCYDYLSVITGPNCCLDPLTVSRFLQNEPQPTSVKNMIHLAQTVRYGILSKFNYLRADYNLHYYGQSTPPIYNLSNIPNDLPLFLSYGGRDALSDVQDVGTLLDYLKYHDKDKIAVQFIEEYAHADFIMATNAKDMVYSAMIKFFNRQ